MHGADQEDGHHHHQDVRLARGGDERRQMMRRSGVKRMLSCDETSMRPLQRTARSSFGRSKYLIFGHPTQ